MLISDTDERWKTGLIQVVSASGRDAFYVSHDEFCYFASRDASVVANVASQFE